MASELRVYFTAYVAGGRMHVAPLGTPLDAGPAEWVDVGPVPDDLVPLILDPTDVYQATALADPGALPGSGHPVAAEPGTIRDAGGLLLPVGVTSVATWPLSGRCATCGQPVRADIDGGEALIWLHAARCQHCEADIMQATGGVWMDGDGITVCAKAPAIGQLLLHKPMPQVT